MIGEFSYFCDFSKNMHEKNYPVFALIILTPVTCFAQSKKKSASSGVNYRQLQLN